MTLDKWADSELIHRSEQGLLRTTRTYIPTLINFSSNDYLNLASDIRLKEAASQAIEKYGCSASSSRLVCGTHDIHTQLETELAAFLNKEAALIFGSGFLANLGTITALCSKDDTIFEDRLNHASLIDASRYSKAKVVRYKHCSTHDLEKQLCKFSAKGKRVIITDSLFSMDGDIAPLQEIHDLAKKYDAVMIVDEAHSIGVFGNGLCQKIPVDIITGSFGKALGSYGGFAACSEKIKQLLTNTSRSFIYSTALPPSCCAAVIEALSIITKNPLFGEEILEKARYFCALSNLPPPHSQIIPLIISDNEKTLYASQRLLNNNIQVVAIRPPSVPAHGARLRFSITRYHTQEDLTYTARIIKETICHI